MNNLIVFAAITMALYGKAQSCCNNSNASEVQRYCCNTYNSCNIPAIQQLQYNISSINCSSCPAKDGVMQFIEAARLLTDELGIMLNSTIINNTAILVINNSDVSFIDLWCLYSLDILILSQDSSVSGNNFKKVMGEFSPICQGYTDVLAHKYYLQHLLFNEAINDTVTIQLFSVITKLQVMGNSLENAQRVHCEHFTVNTLAT